MILFPKWKDWRHITKIDPDKPCSNEMIEVIVESGTDAIVVGGTQNISREKVLNVYKLLRPYSIPKILEVSKIDAITFGFDGYLIPTVLNAGDPKWIIGAHAKAVKRAGKLMDWSIVLPEGYIILNPQCAAAKLTEAKKPLKKRDILAYSSCGENLFKLPIIYIEYSGTYGDPKIVRSVKGILKRAHLFYGGGIDNAQKAKEMGQFADTIVVGNMIYTDAIENLKDTVIAVKGEI